MSRKKRRRRLQPQPPPLRKKERFTGSYGYRLIGQGREGEVERFLPRAQRHALVQCWECGDARYRLVGVGRPEEITCALCGGAVEVLQVV